MGNNFSPRNRRRSNSRSGSDGSGSVEKRINTRYHRKNLRLKIPDGIGEYHNEPKFGRKDCELLQTVIRRLWKKLVDGGDRFVNVCGAYRLGIRDIYSVPIVLCGGDNTLYKSISLLKTFLSALYKSYIVEKMSQISETQFRCDINVYRLVSHRGKKYDKRPAPLPVTFYITDKSSWGTTLLRMTGPQSFYEKLIDIAHRKHYKFLD